MKPVPEGYPSLEEAIRSYRNTTEDNDRLFQQLTRMTAADPLLHGHRRHIEQGKLGFGDSAFHAMWKLIVADIAGRTSSPSFLEVGVYKGQVISLWSLLLQELGLDDARVFAVSPFKGEPAPVSPLKQRMLALLSAKFRERQKNGDFYESLDYKGIIRRLFEHHGLAFDRLLLVEGFSTDPQVRARLAGEQFDLVYLDGGHTYEVVTEDLNFFAERLRPGGYIVTDDSSTNLPGTVFWKGHPSVSKAVDDWMNPRFPNVLNCGHNRVFRRAG